MQLKNAGQEDLNARLASLETGFSEMRQTVVEIGGNVKALSNEFQASRRPQWQLLATMIGLLFSAIMMASAVLALAGKASISPIEARLMGQQEVIERHDRRVEGLLTLTSPLDARFTEVETQFRMLSHLTNENFSEQDRFIAMLWHRVYGEELPKNGDRPVIGRE
jgi:hypothetical protein